ncbi:MAG: hypothetical protein JW795_08880 [Chitinivibrionales bacterium]|nr:hypothetical protein [Chitinivibrionales bacterium]
MKIDRLKAKYGDGALVAFFFLCNTVVFFSFHFIAALERTDKDLPFYCMELQKLLLGQPTGLMYHLFRVFIPALSIVVSWILSVNYVCSMQLLSILSLICLIIYIVTRFSSSPGIGRNLALLLLSTPVVTLYSWSYFIEIPFFTFLMISFWEWDDFCSKGDKKSFWMVMFCSCCGILTKEAFLCHLVILGAFTLSYHRTALRRVLPFYLTLIICSIALFFLVYEFLFDLKKELVISSLPLNTVETNVRLLRLDEIASFFFQVKGGFIHALINLFLAFGCTHFFIAQLLVQRKKDLLPLLCYGLFLSLLFIYFMMSINTGHKYAFLCFGSSYFFILSKKLPAIGSGPSLHLKLLANYGINTALICTYVFIKNGTAG